MKRVLQTKSRADVQRILDQIPFSGGYWTGSTKGRTDHYSIKTAAGYEDAARVTYNYDRRIYTVYLPAEGGKTK